MFLLSAFAIHVSFPLTISFSCLSCVRLRSLVWTSVHESGGYTAEPLLSVFTIETKIGLSVGGGDPTMT